MAEALAKVAAVLRFLHTRLLSAHPAAGPNFARHLWGDLTSDLCTALLAPALALPDGRNGFCFFFPFLLGLGLGR